MQTVVAHIGVSFAAHVRSQGAVLMTQPILYKPVLTYELSD